MTPGELVLQAQFLIDSNDKDGARELLASVLEQLAASSNAGESRTVSIAFGMLALLLLLDGDAQCGEAAARSALSLDLASSHSHRALGRALYEQGRFEEALESFEAAAALHEEASAYVLVARTLAKLRRSTDARDISRKALAIDPTCIDAKLVLANALRSEDPKQTRQLLLEVTETDQGDANGWNMLGNSFMNEMDYCEAEAAFRKAVALDNNVWFRVHLAHCLCSQDRKEDAGVVYAETCDANPRSALAFRFKGGFLADIGRNEEAEAAFRKAIDLDPSCPESAYRLGKFLRRVRPGSEAEELIQRAKSDGVSDSDSS